MNIRGKKIRVRVKPKSHKSGVEPQPDGSLIVRVRAIANQGKANEELIQVLSDYFDIPRSLLKITSGHTSKQKTIKVN